MDKKQILYDPESLGGLNYNINVLVLIWAEQHFTSQLRIILHDAVHSENDLKLS